MVQPMSARISELARSGQHRERQSEVLHLCSSLDFLLFVRKWPVKVGFCPIMCAKTTKHGPLVPTDRNL